MGAQASSRRRTRIAVTIRPGMLTRYGYSTRYPAPVRRLALARAARANTPLTVMRRLRLVSTYTKRTQPRTSKVYRSNINWIRKTLFVSKSK